MRFISQYVPRTSFWSPIKCCRANFIAARCYFSRERDHVMPSVLRPYSANVSIRACVLSLVCTSVTDLTWSVIAIVLVFGRIESLRVRFVKFKPVEQKLLKRAPHNVCIAFFFTPEPPSWVVTFSRANSTLCVPRCDNFSLCLDGISSMRSAILFSVSFYGDII